MSDDRGQFPVMMTSGKSPNSYNALHAPGGRDQAALFRGDRPDYGSIVLQRAVKTVRAGTSALVAVDIQPLGR